jgi:SAM-dependent methyltransferase
MKIKKNLKKIIFIIRKTTNKFGNIKQCYICGRKFNHFTKFRGGSKIKSEFIKRLNMVGSDIENYGCMYCGSNDRERHLYMFFDKIHLWEKMKSSEILHFAPEKNIWIKIYEQSPSEYIMADLHPKRDDVIKMDATKIDFRDDYFDLIIANHILEHIPGYHKALSEFHRVLKPGGIAILQTPYSDLLKNNFEDENIDSDELRSFFYGQKDHIRLFGGHQFFESIKDAGFNLMLIKHQDLFGEKVSTLYGVNQKEDLIQVMKPVER